jgi:hypothetical protein
MYDSNVDPRIKPYVEVSNITVVMALPKKPVISARAVLRDLTDNLSDEELMKKHKLSLMGLKSLYKKLLGKRLVRRESLARRIEGQTKDLSLISKPKMPGQLQLMPQTC